MKPVVLTYTLKITLYDLDLGGHLARFIYFSTDFHGHNTDRGARLSLGFNGYLILAQTDQV